MPFPLLIPAITAGIGALGGLLEGRKSARTQTTQPLEPPEYAPLRDQLLRMSLARLQQPSGLPGGFIEGGISNINRTADLSGQNLQNRLLAMGLSDSPVAANAITQGEIARQGGINRFENIEAPLVERDFADRNFQQALQMFGQRPLGTQTVFPGSMAGGAFSSAAELLAYMYGSGAFGGKKN